VGGTPWSLACLDASGVSNNGRREEVRSCVCLSPIDAGRTNVRTWGGAPPSDPIPASQRIFLSTSTTNTRRRGTLYLQHETAKDTVETSTYWSYHVRTLAPSRSGNYICDP
jgi:hypothetical protein